MQNNGQFSSVFFLSELLAQINSSNDTAFPERNKELVKGLEKTLQDLQQVKEFDFREIGDHLYDGIYIADGNGKTVYVNKAYTRITGIHSEEVIGKYVLDLEKEGYFKNAVTPQVMKCKKQVNALAESSRNGTKMLITGNPIFDEQGNIKKVVVIDREITDLLEMRAELEASQLKMQSVEEDKNKNKQEIEHLRKLHLNKNLIGTSPEIQEIISMIHKVASLDVTVLLIGETGSGKEVVANEIYAHGPRSSGPFIKVNCAAIPANLLETELFGYEQGAFTGAVKSGKIGMFELADKGTLLLDEIGDMPVELQSKLLRVIQHKEIIRIGGKKPIKLDVRLVSSTNNDLKKLVEQGKFREDLYYRLNVFPIQIPPLRMRIGDIPVLTKHLLDVYNARYGKQIAVEHSGIDIMKRYSWPGNVRELQNIIERLIIVSDANTIISAEQIGRVLNIDPFRELVNAEMGLREIVETIEKKTIEKAMELYGSTRKAAAVLKIDQSTIVKKLKSWE